jgi:signal-transduction protein with cAMP-binding, CBS, and nucleotidyltransferase domain
MKLRFRNQAEMSDNNLPLSNSLNSRNLIDQEVFLLKKVLTAIPEYQNKIKSDFRITS